MSDIRSLTRTIKEKNPAKFLELLPDLFIGSFLEKISRSTGSNAILNYGMNEVVETKKKEINSKLNDKCDLVKVGIGSLIFLAGNYLIYTIKRGKDGVKNKG